MSKSYKIFGNRGGIDTVQGRNVQLPMSIQRKPESNNQLPNGDKNEISPFFGYSTSHHENNLAHSQVSQVIFNQESMKKVVRQQIEKQNSMSRNKNQINIIKTEIRSIKEFVQELGKKSDLNLSEFQEIREELHTFVTQIFNDYKIESAQNLREVVKKINDNVRKQCIGQLKNQYIPADELINDIQKQFGQIEDRLGLVQSKFDANKNKVFDDPVVLAQTVDLRLKKMEREIQSFKKASGEGSIKVKQLQSLIVAIKKKQEESEQEKILEQQTLQLKIRQQNQQIEKDIKKLITNVEELKNHNSQLNDKIKNMSNDISQYGQMNKISSGESMEIKEFLVNSKNITSSVYETSAINNSVDEKGEEQITINPSPSKITEKNNESSVTDSASKHQDLFVSPTKNGSNSNYGSPTQQLKIPNSPEISQVITEKKDLSLYQQNKQAEQDQEKGLEYRIDTQNHLLDADNSYILNSDGEMVTLTDEQVDLLRKSRFVKLQE